MGEVENSPQGGDDVGRGGAGLDIKIIVVLKIREKYKYHILIVMMRMGNEGWWVGLTGPRSGRRRGEVAGRGETWASSSSPLSSSSSSSFSLTSSSL